MEDEKVVLTRWEHWWPLFAALYDGQHYTGRPLPGADVAEWLPIVQSDYDQIDREFYLDGGGDA